jgi:hypothetical protein
MNIPLCIGGLELFSLQRMVEIINERQTAKKMIIVLPSITIFLGSYRPYIKSNPTQHDFLEDLILYIVILSFVIH